MDVEPAERFYKKKNRTRRIPKIRRLCAVGKVISDDVFIRLAKLPIDKKCEMIYKSYLQYDRMIHINYS